MSPTNEDQKGSPRGPLHGVKVIEVAGLGAGPYTAMVLSDMGADVIRVDRPGPAVSKPERYALSRGRRSIVVDIKQPDGLEVFLSLMTKADVLLEGFRPGVAERLGFGQDECLARNPRLVYGRMTGWGQDGPLAQMAGHDLNYLGLTGALTLLQRNRESRPATPPGLIADFGGGGLMLAFGVVCALLEARQSGAGQVVDAAMVDGVASLTTLIYSMMAQDRWVDEPGTNFCDGGSPYYDSYETSDGRYVMVCCLEPPFYAAMLLGLGLDPASLPAQNDRTRWPELRARFEAVFRSRTRDEWVAVFEGTDACVTPVLDMGEAIAHPHNRARGVFVGEQHLPAAAPRFIGTPTRHAPATGADPDQLLRQWGIELTAPRTR